MTCSKCLELLVAFGEGVLDGQLHEQAAAHLRDCVACRVEADEQERLRHRLFRDAAALSTPLLERPVMGRIIQEQSYKLRRNAMRKRYGKIGLALAAAVIAVALFIPSWHGPLSARATAAEVLAGAVEALSDLDSVYLKLNVRTIARDNFELIGLDYDFVPHEMWKQFGQIPKWRIEKPGRVVVMDGTSSLLWIKYPEPGRAAKGGVHTGFVDWLLPLLDVDEVLDSELRLANRFEASQVHFELEAQGAGKVVITIEMEAQGDFANDWLKNKSISASNHRRVYTFDGDTRRLEDLEVWVHGEDRDVLVLDIEEIVYNPVIDPDLFTLALPDEVIWSEDPKVLTDNAAYARMTPDQAARAFFQACANRDWDEVLKFYSMSELDQRFKGSFGTLEVLSIGKPFKSGQYPGWFVPYKVRLGNGRVLSHNLALRNDNSADRYVVDGGI